MNKNKKRHSESKLMVAVVATTTLLLAQIPNSQAAGADARRDARAAIKHPGGKVDQAKARITARAKQKNAARELIRMAKDRQQGCASCHSLNLNTSQPFAEQLRHVQSIVSSHPTSANVSNCNACHAGGSSGVRDWKVPTTVTKSAIIDFARATDSDVCEALKDPGPHSGVREHLLQDPLVIWAIAGRSAPRGTTRSHRNRFNSWRHYVTTWMSTSSVVRVTNKTTNPPTTTPIRVNTSPMPCNINPAH